MNKHKIAIVCQRYGLDVNGGSELYCRQLAEKLTAYYDIEIYTTCATDYVTWANEYTPGTEIINGVTVHRFTVDKERNQKMFNEISAKMFGKSKHSLADEELWVEEQGPVCTELLQMITEKHQEYKVVIFMTYLYYLTAKGLPIGFENTLLIPTVHDEPPVYLKYYDKVFSAARGFIWLTPEETKIAEKRFACIKDKPGVLAGVGIDVPTGELPDIPELLKNIPYIVYAGRIDESKGCGEMFQYFQRYKQEYGGPLKLVLMGKAVMNIPAHSDIISLGFVSDEMKFAVMRSAKMLVLFSQFESLSMVVLESMIMGRPVLVTGKCEVLKGHCIRSNAGLYFESYDVFAGCLNYLLTHPMQYEIMQKNAVAYVQENYQWDKILTRICGLIDKIGETLK